MSSVKEASKSQLDKLKLVNNPITRFDFVQKLEWFLLSAVLMILVIRTQLWLTNYPQLGGGGLHIAHLLWGGLFMMVAIWCSLIYLNRAARTVTAILGGIGFGFFIDELGKFITSDNNYFFKPAAGIIYIIFIVMFLVIRELSKRQKLSPRTALANALAFMPSTITGEFRREEYVQANALLDQADQSDPTVEIARRHFNEVKLAPVSPPTKVQLWIARVHDWITGLTERPRFEAVVITLVIIWAIITLLSGFTIEVNGSGTQSSDAGNSNGGFIDAGRGISILVSFTFVAIGCYRMARKEHQAAYRNFSRALLVSIFITQFFTFVESQFGAVIGLIFNIILFSAVSELASRDRQSKYSFGGIKQSEIDDRQNGGDGEETQKG